MKKQLLTLMFALAFLCSITVSTVKADGNIPIGGKNCPEGQSCFISTDNQTPKENPIVEIWKYLRSVFAD